MTSRGSGSAPETRPENGPVRLREYRANSAPNAVDSLRDLWSARGVVRAFTVRSIRVRYRQAFLGMLWVVAQPLALLVPLTLFLGDQTPRIDGVRFAASTLAALVGWNFLSTAVVTGAGALVSEAALIRKTWFPREAPVVAAVAAALLELGIGSLLAVAAGPLLGAHLGRGLLAWPLAAASLALVALAVSLPLAALNAQFRDVRHALSFVVLVWLFITPVMYSVDRVPARWRPWYAAVNPAVGPLDAFRRTLAHGTWPHWNLLAISLAAALVVALMGHAAFRRLAPTLPDVI